MSNLLGWLKAAAVKTLDPGREQRIAVFAEEIWRQLKEQRSAFNFKQTMIGLGADIEDNLLVAEHVYGDAVRRAWKDGTVTATERLGLDFIGHVLPPPPERVREIELQQGLNVFERVFGQAIADGRLDSEEVTHLNAVASGIGLSVRELMVRFFAGRGEEFLRGLFATVVQERGFSSREWQSLVETARALGLDVNDLRDAISLQANAYVEHVLADAKSDGRITDVEKQTIDWLVRTLGISPELQNYILSEIETIELYNAIANGNLPTLEVRHLALRAGEIAHHHCAAAYEQVKQSQSGPRSIRHDGGLVITDWRMIFTSDTKSVDLNHRRVVSLLPLNGGVEVRAGGPGAGRYYFGGDANLASAIYQAAVAKANQTLVERLEGASTRHIPRDVRQRVWQKYAGRCADCGATQYLEFDHIVPVARGGSNSDANVQLLCRGCNSKKSDRI